MLTKTDFRNRVIPWISRIRSISGSKVYYKHIDPYYEVIGSVIKDEAIYINGFVGGKPIMLRYCFFEGYQTFEDLIQNFIVVINAKSLIDRFKNIIQ